MKRHPWLKLLIPAAALGIVLSLWAPGGRRAATTVSFLPEANRFAGLRFDPSYFYGRGVTARELASRLVPLWQEAGLNVILFRAYDPVHGASYRTSAAYNTETDYGRQDLLRWVLEEAHARHMKVYAWLTPWNHRGAWEARKEWRALNADGEPYQAQALPYPLCPRQRGVEEWWLRFIEELLDRYPDLDGLDLAEPVLGWRERDACFCDRCSSEIPKGPPAARSEGRARPLTDLLLETFRRSRARGKETLLTTVLPAGRDGNPLPFTALRDQTGLDLERVLASPERPRRLAVELLWQEWGSVHQDLDLFRPAWAKRAVQEVRRRVAGRVSVLGHLELTDFGGVEVRPEDLAAGLAAAIEGGAEGFEVYDASLLERKRAWGALRAGLSAHPRKRVLIVYHPGEGENRGSRRGPAAGESDARQLATLCGHFACDAALRPLDQYAAGEGRSYDALVYIGARDGTTPGEPFLRDVESAEAPVLWLGANIQNLLQRADRFGFAHLESRIDASGGTVRYKGRALLRQEPLLNSVRVTESAKVRVLAEVESPGGWAPYALRSGPLWYFADNPLSYAIEGGAYAVLADLLHDVLGEDHAEKKLAMVRLEDVHPLTPPGDIRAAARFLHGRGVPFLISLVPFYHFPEKGEYSSLEDEPEFVEALREAVSLGATIVLHGVTHQLTGESGADYEFWDAARDGAPEDRTDARTRARLLLGLGECRRHGIYPLLWETPHYAATLKDYAVVSQVFSAAIERRQSADRIGSDQLYPYVIFRDPSGQLLLPENLGYVPLADQRAGPILEAAERTAVVRDATVCFFYHLFCKQRVLEEIVDGLLERAFTFPDVRTLGLSVTGPDFRWCTTRSPFPKDLPGTDAALLDQRGEEVWRGPAADFPRADEPPIGTRLFLPPEAEGEEVASEGPRARVQPGLLVRSLRVGVHASEDEAALIGDVFRAVAAPTARLDLEDGLSASPEGFTLIVVSEASARSLPAAARARLRGWLEGGGAVLTWGRTPLAEELGVRFTGDERDVAQVEDPAYPDSVVRLGGPARVAATALDSRDEILRKQGEVPLLTALTRGQGNLLYSALPPFGPGGAGPYPHLIDTLKDQGIPVSSCRSKRLEVYFDPSQRENVSVEDLVKRWARHGVRVVHAGGWHESPDWTYEYDRLIELAHQNAILVYAWLPLPLVSEKFWMAHPEWREKNLRGEDVNVDWRRAVSLLDPACLGAVKEWLRGFLGRFDFDGVNLAGLSFGGESLERPETLSPFSEAARRDFREKHEFDPRELWDEGSPRSWKRSPEGLQAFLTWRKLWTTRLHRDLIAFLSGLPAPSPRALVVSLPDAAAKPDAADLAGVDVRKVLKLREELPFQVQVMDPGDARPWGAARFQGIIRDYPEVGPSDLVFGIDITQGGQVAGGSLTGVPLYLLLASAAGRTVAIYSEDGIPDADWGFLAPALASHASVAWGPNRLAVSSTDGARVPVEPGKDLLARVDGKPWLGVGRGEVLVPPGERRLELARGPGDEPARVVDTSCTLLEAEAVPRGIRFVYESRERAAILLSRKAVEVMIDGRKTAGTLPAGERGHPFLGPPGRHEVVAVIESWPEFAVRVGSLALSGGIVAFSGSALGLLSLLFVWARLGHRKSRRRQPAAIGSRS